MFDWFCVSYWFLRKDFKIKKPSGEVSLFVFFNVEENRLEVELELI